MQLTSFLIPEKAPLRHALLQIEANHHGFVLTTSVAGSVIGLATDGDIRRKLLEGSKLDEPVADSANTDFVWAFPNTPREILLKKLVCKSSIINPTLLMKQ